MTTCKRSLSVVLLFGILASVTVAQQSKGKGTQTKRPPASSKQESRHKAKAAHEQRVINLNTFPRRHSSMAFDEWQAEVEQWQAMTPQQRERHRAEKRNAERGGAVVIPKR